MNSETFCIVGIIIIFVILFCFETTRDFLEKNHATFNLLLTTLGVVIAGLFANTIIVKIDNINTSIKDFYSTYTEEKFDLKDLTATQFTNLSTGSQLEINLKEKPIPLSMRVWFGAENGEDLLGPWYYKINNNVFILKLPNLKDTYLNNNETMFLDLIYQEDKN